MDINGPGKAVLLIHGIFDTDDIFWQMSQYLINLGWDVHSFNLSPNTGGIGLDKLAEQVEDYVNKKFVSDQLFNIVGFSMGGIVSRYYLQRLGGIQRVNTFISISSPHNGTWTAYPLALPGILQMRPDSDFLRDLNSDIQMLENINFVSMWTPLDLMIMPANSSHVNVGKEMKFNVLRHDLMVKDPTVIKAVEQELCLGLGRQVLEQMKADRQQREDLTDFYNRASGNL